jgi:predicted nucleic acid-binding protein
MNKILLDTNIFVYSIDRDSRYYQQCQRIIQDTRLELYTTSKNISEFLAVITRLPQSRLSIEKALELVSQVSNFTTVLYPSDLSSHIFIDLLKKYKPVGLKIHDFEIVSIALANHCTRIASVNAKDYRDISEIELIEPR